MKEKKETGAIDESKIESTEAPKPESSNPMSITVAEYRVDEINTKFEQIPGMGQRAIGVTGYRQSEPIKGREKIGPIDLIHIETLNRTWHTRKTIFVEIGKEKTTPRELSITF